MQNSLKTLRYLIFGIFIICNAIVASVAVWNHSQAETVEWVSGEKIDLYLTFLGCFGLALIFTIIFVELACKNPITGRVWFECTWVGLFWILYLAGATAVSITAPDKMCNLRILPRLSAVNSSCISTRVIIAFSWVNAIILLSYFLLLVIASLIHSSHDSRIWHRYVYKFPWSDFRHSVSSVPASPPLPRFLKQMPSIVAPKPQRAAPSALYNYRSGLSLEYEIEHYHPPSHTPRPPINFPVLPVPPATHTPGSVQQPTHNHMSSFYPQYMQSALMPTLQRSESHIPQHPIRLPSPLPLGDWPRPNATMQPLRSKRDKHPITGEPLVKTTLRPRPSGPRRKSGTIGGSQLIVQE